MFSGPKLAGFEKLKTFLHCSPSCRLRLRNQMLNHTTCLGAYTHLVTKLVGIVLAKLSKLKIVLISTIVILTGGFDLLWSEELLNIFNEEILLEGIF